MNRPVSVVEPLDYIDGFSYSPYRRDQTPLKGVYPSYAEIEQDMKQLGGIAHRVRTYNSTENPEVSDLAGQNELRVTAGAWLDRYKVKNRREIGALLEEARLVKRLQPTHNRQLRRNRELCTWRLVTDIVGDWRLELVHAVDLDFGRRDDLYGFFRTRREATDRLRVLARDHALCPPLLGLEKPPQGARCFDFQLKRCRGACHGGDSPQAHALRLIEALHALKVEHWTWPGPIGLHEGEAIHVVDGWRWLGTATDEVTLADFQGCRHAHIEGYLLFNPALADKVMRTARAAGCTIKLNPEPIKEYLTSNIVLMKNMIADGYEDKRTLQRRIEKVEAWLAKPELLEADKDAEYAAVIEIDLADIKEPILCCPNDPDDAKTLSDVAGTKIDEAFIGSCMTNIGHFRAAAKLLGGSRDIPVKLWVAPPTKMDESELIKEGHYAAFGTAGARTEMPGCSLCMGNQAQVREGATVVSTSTRNFPNRLGKNTNVFLASAELAAIASKLGHIPTVAEYHEAMGIVNKDGAAIYKYLNFDQIEEYAETAKGVTA